MKPGPVLAVFRKLLGVAREDLGMDVAWLSEFIDGEQRFRVVDGNGALPAIVEGLATPIEGSYCTRVLDGRLPAVVSDARDDERTASLPITDYLGIGSYVGVPVQRPDGRIYGMLCCASRSALSPEQAPQLRLLRTLAGHAVEEMQSGASAREGIAQKRARIQRTITGRRLGIVVQPIVELSTMRKVGGESLSRFIDLPARPDVWFTDAADVGLGEELELHAVSTALELLPSLPPDKYLAVNVSPVVALSPSLRHLILASDPERILLEITEHRSVSDYDVLNAALAPLRQAGVRLAVDDAGAGFASFSHILALRPDVIKIDIGITRNLDVDPVRASLAQAIVAFGERLGARVVAEGVETQGELDALLRIGVHMVQGYFLARPAPLPLPKIAVRPTTHDVGHHENLFLHALTIAERQAGDDHGRLVNALLALLLEATGLECASLALLDRCGSSLEHRWARGSGPVAIRPGLKVPLRDSVVSRCDVAGLVWTAAASVDLGTGAADALAAETVVVVPLVTAGKVRLGALCALSKQPRYLSGEAISRAQLLGRLLADRFASMREAA